MYQFNVRCHDVLFFINDNNLLWLHFGSPTVLININLKIEGNHKLDYTHTHSVKVKSITQTEILNGAVKKNEFINTIHKYNPYA